MTLGLQERKTLGSREELECLFLGLILDHQVGCEQITVLFGGGRFLRRNNAIAAVQDRCRKILVRLAEPIDLACVLYLAFDTVELFLN